MLFSQLNLSDAILQAIQKEGYTNPTPIQQQSIPIILQGKDLLGCAQTGTGKTAAFAMPILQLLAANNNKAGGRKIRSLILTPTRELAIQIEESLRNYGAFTGLNQLVIFGGVPQNSQTNALRRGIDILVATPGRLLDLMNQGFVDLRSLEIFVLDEADRMLDMGFVHDVKRIIQKIPAKRQTLFFSATMPPEIQKLADTILVNPARVEVTPVSSTAQTIQQSLYYVSKGDKKSLLNHILEDETIETALVFTRTKHGADKVTKDLSRAGITAEAIHGNKSQNARQRALTNFKTRQTRVLVATDIAARGIDVDNLTHVINFDLPNIPETYVHRIGRTGRAGANGIAISFCDHEEREFLRDINKLIGKTVPVITEHPFKAGSPSHIAVSSAPSQQVRSSNMTQNRRPARPANNNRPAGKPVFANAGSNNGSQRPIRSNGNVPGNQQERRPNANQRTATVSQDFNTQDNLSY
ncbi:MAG: DEAD/DEAH box helicase [Chitinophagaceae bacterium]|nr:MAG: DEAD/DEAH box helicase [Chitinophagaceae bacterium]